MLSAGPCLLSKRGLPGFQDALQPVPGVLLRSVCVLQDGPIMKNAPVGRFLNLAERGDSFGAPRLTLRAALPCRRLRRLSNPRGFSPPQTTLYNIESGGEGGIRTPDTLLTYA